MRIHDYQSDNRSEGYPDAPCKSRHSSDGNTPILLENLRTELPTRNTSEIQRKKEKKKEKRKSTVARIGDTPQYVEKIVSELSNIILITP